MESGPFRDKEKRVTMSVDAISISPCANLAQRGTQRAQLAVGSCWAT